MIDCFVLVLEAKGLEAVDFGGTSDPYCVLSFGEVQQRTRSRSYVLGRECARSSLGGIKPLLMFLIRRKLNPVWNETFILYVSNEGSYPGCE